MSAGVGVVTGMLARHRVLVLLALVAVAGSLVWQLVLRTDREMREELRWRGRIWRRARLVWWGFRG